NTATPTRPMAPATQNGAAGVSLHSTPAEERRRRDRQAPDEVVKSDGASAQRGAHQVDDHRLAGWLTDLAQTAHDEGADQRREIVGQHDGDGEGREGDER